MRTLPTQKGSPGGDSHVTPTLHERDQEGRHTVGFVDFEHKHCLSLLVGWASSTGVRLLDILFSWYETLHGGRLEQGIRAGSSFTGQDPDLPGGCGRHHSSGTQVQEAVVPPGVRRFLNFWELRHWDLCGRSLWGYTSSGFGCLGIVGAVAPSPGGGVDSSSTHWTLHSACFRTWVLGTFE